MASALRLAVLAGTLSACIALPAGSVRTAWFAGWHADPSIDHPFLPDDVSWEKYTHMTFAFAETMPDGSLDLSGSGGSGMLHSFVDAAHSNNVKALVSVGGWTGSRFWSTSVGSADNRTAFVDTLSSFLDEYALDGLDFDWEYPNNQGLGCNTISSDDTSNFLAFLNELRDSIGSDPMLTAATAIRPFMDSTSTPSSDVSGFADVLDYIAVMNYDLWGSWSSTVGPNAPLNDSCAPAESQQGSAVSAVTAWSQAGMPANQMVLGVPSYGHSFSVSPEVAFVDGTSGPLRLYADFDSSEHPAGDAWDDGPGVDACGVQQPQGGNWDFWGLIEAGYLDAQGRNVSDFPFAFDTCSQTAYLYGQEKQVEISFDNADSFTAKGNFIMTQGLAGYAMWEAGGDSNDILIDAINNALGGTSNGSNSSNTGGSSGGSNAAPTNMAKRCKLTK